MRHLLNGDLLQIARIVGGLALDLLLVAQLAQLVVEGRLDRGEQFVSGRGCILLGLLEAGFERGNQSVILVV